MSDAILRVNHLKKYFSLGKKSLFQSENKYVKAVDDVSFDLFKGETLGIVGESGCGKSTTGKLIMQLIRPTEGEIILKGKNLCNLSGVELRKARRNIQMVFQDPYASLDPRQTVKSTIEEPMIIHGIKDKKQRHKRVQYLLEQVGLQDYHAQRYPHEFSGGQRQRINIARALALNPEVIICDEPVSALDVSIQAQVINLLNELQKTFHLTYIFIAHDLNIVKHISDRIIVMYLGKIMEMGRYDQVYDHALHPYTKSLLSAIAVPNPRVKKEKDLLTGEPPSPVDPPSGCVFHTRCRYAIDKCKKEIPVLREVEQGHQVACHLSIYR